MATPKSTVWDLAPHTRAKHEILRRYLQAWVPILSLGGFPQFLYIDGFAGPGCYSRGEEGSPVIALRAAINQIVKIKATILFLFVEKDQERAKILHQVVAGLPVPGTFRIKVAGGQTFETAFTELVDSLRSKGRPLPPTFAFIDPFGWTGVPFSVVEDILSHPSCEVLVTFMYEDINRFLGHPAPVQGTNFDLFFGTQDWRSGIDLANPGDRNRFLHDLYIRQLRESAGAKFVRSFEMRNDRDVVDYYLFYATNNLKGLQKMKEAMWKVDESGEFRFSDATDPGQLLLFDKAPDFNLLRKQIIARFGGREASIKEIEEFVLADTAFRESHYKREVLKPMELAKPPQIEVIDPPGERKRGTYPEPVIRLRFLVKTV